MKAGKSLKILQIKDKYKAYMTLLIFLSNPKAQLEFIRSIDASLADQISSEGNGAKIDRVVNRAKSFKENKKYSFCQTLLKILILFKGIRNFRKSVY